MRFVNENDLKFEVLTGYGKPFLQMRKWGLINTSDKKKTTTKYTHELKRFQTFTSGFR